VARPVNSAVTIRCVAKAHHVDGNWLCSSRAPQRSGKPGALGATNLRVAPDLLILIKAVFPQCTSAIGANGELIEGECHDSSRS
jgi:hypothetical protein